MNYSMWVYFEFFVYFCMFPCKRASACVAFVFTPWAHFSRVDMWCSFCLSIATPQFPGEQPHTGQSGGGAGHAGVRYHQRQNQTASRATDQDSGWLVGVYVAQLFDSFVEIENEKRENLYRPLLKLFSSTSLQNVQFKMAAWSTLIDFFVPFVLDVKQSHLCWRYWKMFPMCPPATPAKISYD